MLVFGKVYISEASISQSMKFGKKLVTCSVYTYSITG